MPTRREFGLGVGATAGAALLAQNPDADIVSFYAAVPQPSWYIAVKPVSPVKELKDLKGKSIGIVNVGDTGYFAAKAMFKEPGIDPASDVSWVTVGAGGPAGQALASGRVDALAEWDILYSVIEKLGFLLRALPNTPGQKHVIGATYATKRATFEKKRDFFAPSPNRRYLLIITVKPQSGCFSTCIPRRYRRAKRRRKLLPMASTPSCARISGFRINRTPISGWARYRCRNGGTR